MVVADIHDAARRRTEYVAQESPEIGLILRRHVRIPLGVFEEEIPGLRIFEITFVGKSSDNAACEVAEDFRFAPDRLAREAPSDIAVNRIGNIGAGTIRDETKTRYVDLRFAEIGCRVAGGITQLYGHDEFCQLLPDVGLLMNVVHLGGKGGHSQDDITDRRLA